MNRLDGKVALVTGGGQGVGLGIARAMAAAGARVALVDRVANGAERAAAEIGGIGLAGDVVSPADAARCVDEVGAATRARSMCWSTTRIR